MPTAIMLNSNFNGGEQQVEEEVNSRNSRESSSSSLAFESESVSPKAIIHPQLAPHQQHRHQSTFAGAMIGQQDEKVGTITSMASTPVRMGEDAIRAAQASIQRQQETWKQIYQQQQKEALGGKSHINELLSLGVPLQDFRLDHSVAAQPGQSTQQMLAAQALISDTINRTVQQHSFVSSAATKPVFSDPFSNTMLQMEGEHAKFTNGQTVDSQGRVSQESGAEQESALAPDSATIANKRKRLSTGKADGANAALPGSTEVGHSNGEQAKARVPSASARKRTAKPKGLRATTSARIAAKSLLSLGGPQGMPLQSIPTDSSNESKSTLTTNDSFEPLHQHLLAPASNGLSASAIDWDNMLQLHTGAEASPATPKSNSTLVSEARTNEQKAFEQLLRSSLENKALQPVVPSWPVSGLNFTDPNNLSGNLLDTSEWNSAVTNANPSPLTVQTAVSQQQWSAAVPTPSTYWSSNSAYTPSLSPESTILAPSSSTESTRAVPTEPSLQHMFASNRIRRDNQVHSILTSDPYTYEGIVCHVNPTLPSTNSTFPNAKPAICYSMAEEGLERQCGWRIDSTVQSMPARSRALCNPAAKFPTRPLLTGIVAQLHNDWLEHHVVRNAVASAPTGLHAGCSHTNPFTTHFPIVPSTLESRHIRTLWQELENRRILELSDSNMIARFRDQAAEELKYERERQCALEHVTDGIPWLTREPTVEDIDQRAQANWDRCRSAATYTVGLLRQAEYCIAQSVLGFHPLRSGNTPRNSNGGSTNSNSRTSENVTGNDTVKSVNQVHDSSNNSTAKGAMVVNGAADIREAFGKSATNANNVVLEMSNNQLVDALPQQVRNDFGGSTTLNFMTEDLNSLA